jgi:hypothetical protein
MKFELIFDKFLIYMDLWKEKQRKKLKFLKFRSTFEFELLLSKYYSNSINPNIKSQSMK